MKIAQKTKFTVTTTIFFLFQRSRVLHTVVGAAMSIPSPLVVQLNFHKKLPRGPGCAQEKLKLSHSQLIFEAKTLFLLTIRMPSTISI
jgi:hypothetical protein